MKTRFTALDVRVIVNELKKQLDGMRLQNIYDSVPHGRTFLLKFSKSNEKCTVVVESGSRIHSTQFEQEKRMNIFPSNLIATLRKYLKGKRVSSIEQVAFDRIVHIKFGGGSSVNEDGINEASELPSLSENVANESHLNQRHVFNLYLELFSQGNLILTDFEGKILAILRVVESESVGKLSLGEYYNPYEKALELKLINIYDFNDYETYLRAFPPQIMEYLLKSVGIEKKKGKQSGLVVSEDKRDKFIGLYNEIVEEINSCSNARGGTIQINRKSDLNRPPILDTSDLLTLNDCTEEEKITLHSYECLDRMTAHIPASCKIKFSSFNEAVDVFYARLEAERLSQKKHTIESMTEKKLRYIEEEQKERIRIIETSMADMLEEANLITKNAEQIDAAILVTRSAINSGLDWTEFWRLIQSEQKSLIKKRAEVARLFFGLNLEEDKIILKMEEEDGKEDAKTRIKIDFTLTAHGNATKLFEQRNQLKLKLERTLKSYEMAMKSAAQKIKSDSYQPRQRIKKRGQLQVLRKPFWFEKFHWFISSEGYLVIAGRDPKQSEIILKKYFKKGDVLVYSDAVEGAAIVIIKNDDASMTIPLKTLFESGMFSISFSDAWEEKRVSNSWWVSHEQVSTIIQSCSGSKASEADLPELWIKGPKNFLPPTPINISFGFIFLLDETGRNKKRNERMNSEGNSSNRNIVEDQDFLLKMKKYQVDEDSLKAEAEEESVTIIKLNQNEIKESGERGKRKSQLKVEPQPQPQSQIQLLSNSVENLSLGQKKGTKSVRGKHGKEKKMKKKYGNQDEEERNLRLELLGSVGTGSGTGNNKKSSNYCTQNQKPQSTKVSTNSLTNRKELEVEAVNDNPNPKKAVSEQNLNLTLESDESPDDMEVCFPTSALATVQLRIKLIPGTQKKGKAVKTAVGLLTTGSISDDVKNLIRAVPEDEMIAVMPGKVAFASEHHGHNRESLPTTAETRKSNKKNGGVKQRQKK